MPRNPVAAQGEVELSRRTHDAAAEDATVSRTGARSHKRASLFASWLSSSLRLDNQQHLVGAGFDPAVFAAPIIYWVAWHFQRAVHVGSTGGGDIFSALLESGGPRTLDFNYAGGWFCTRYSCNCFVFPSTFPPCADTADPLSSLLRSSSPRRHCCF